MKIVILVAMAFMGDIPLQPKAFPYTDMATCEAGRADLAKEFKETAPPGLTVWSRCVETDRDMKPQVDPKHRDPKSEVRS
jgi:hypothetical protein